MIAPELLEQLCALVRRLRAESADFLEHQEDAQLWYNRGYANGMVLVLQSLLREDRPCGESPDDEDTLRPHRVMAWGKAYDHGEAMGKRETHEITGTS